MDLTGKGVFLTGGAGGIGRGIMEALLAKGAKVLFCDVNESTGKKNTESELQEKYGADRVIFRLCDVINAQQLTVHFLLDVEQVMDLTGKRVFLTGGARGIGRGIVEALLARKTRVFFCDVDEDTGKATETELQKVFGADNVLFRKCEVTNADELKVVFEAAVSKFGAADIYVNNAAILNEGIWEKMIQINVIGTIRGCQLAMEHMRRDKGGQGGLIINVVSDCGLMPVHWVPAYNATKHAVMGFSTSWAKNPKMPEWGIRWRCFCPRATDTPFIQVKEGMVLDLEDYLSACLKNVMKVSEVADLFVKVVQDEESDDVIFLVDFDGKSRYVRRQLVDSDGVSNPLLVDGPAPSSAGKE